MQMSGVQCDSLTLKNKELEKSFAPACEVVLFINKPNYPK